MAKVAVVAVARAASTMTPSGTFGQALYNAEQRGELPERAVLAALGCGNPTAVAELREGETVLDLGSGGGIDLILSAKRVGVTGVVYGLDMTDEMLALARRNVADAGVANVHLLRGVIEEIPLPADTVDVVISNCVINLSVDKAKVLTEIARVLSRVGGSESATWSPTTSSLRPSGRIGGASPDASRARSRGASTRPGSRPPASTSYPSSSRTRSPTECTARSSGREDERARGPGLPVIQPAASAGCC